MPWLPIYADEEDFRLILDRLNRDDEIAFIISDGPKKWRAVRSIPSLHSHRICLWHVPSGPLPLLYSRYAKPGQIIDPWDGWTELRSGRDNTNPYFGPSHPGVIWFNSRCLPNTICLSSFEWAGNLHAKAGRPAPEATTEFWARLRGWAKKNAVRITRSGTLESLRPEIWAFRSALSAIRRGVDRQCNPGA